MTTSAGGGSPLNLRAMEARHPATVVLEAGEHHSQDVRERIQAHVDVTALLALLRQTRAALRPFVEMGKVEGKFLTARPDSNTAVILINLGAFRRAAAALAQAVEGG